MRSASGSRPGSPTDRFACRASASVVAHAASAETRRAAWSRARTCRRKQAATTKRPRRRFCTDPPAPAGRWCYPPGLFWGETMDTHQLEAFALAKDRAKALEQFIPGTEEHYFHACLYH